jgi:outer membrane lipopolysaccharide assembly protein LptE/RlpB
VNLSKSVLICVLLIFSCVYSFTSGSFDGTLSILSLENKTQNPDIDRILTEGLIDAFISDGRVKIETGSEGDYLLDGVIDDYERSPESYTPGGEVEEYRLSVNVKFSLKKKDKEENEWDKPINESFVYPAEFDELDAVDSVVTKIKSSLLRLMLEEW